MRDVEAHLTVRTETKNWLSISAFSMSAISLFSLIYLVFLFWPVYLQNPLLLFFVFLFKFSYICSLVYLVPSLHIYCCQQTNIIILLFVLKVCLWICYPFWYMSNTQSLLCGFNSQSFGPKMDVGAECGFRHDLRAQFQIHSFENSAV